MKVVGALLLLMACGAMQAHGDEVSQGERIYREGILPNGAPLVGVRPGGITVMGSEAACVTCHRRSGMGSVEGDIQVPPINGRFLFAHSGEKALATMDPRSGKRMNQRHAPYDTEAFAHALRDGINVGGRAMNVMMPRYALADEEVHALEAYLHQLSAQWSPGVNAETIRFATVITPGVDPARREALLATLRAAFAQKNASIVSGRASARRRMVSPAEMVLGTSRTWELDVWELSGAPESWSEQLAQRYRAQPVFALVSGIGADWSPIDRFCSAQQIPCWFPSVDLAAQQSNDYSLHFSGGVSLEAAVLAQHMAKAHPRRRVVQIVSDDAAAQQAADAFERAYSGEVTRRTLAEGSESLTNAMRDLPSRGRRETVIVAWLRRADMTRLDAISPRGEAIYFSSLLAGENALVPPAWRGRAALIYPFELPEARAANMEYFRAWLKIRGLTLVDERVQSEAYFAVDYLTATVSEMLDNLQRDYLLERAAEMLSRSEAVKAEDQTRLVVGAGPTTSRPRSGSTLYPRLSLAQGQHFASKGAYVVRFADGESDRLVALTEWIVP